jgi:hypothetical protein
MTCAQNPIDLLWLWVSRIGGRSVSKDVATRALLTLSAATLLASAPTASSAASAASPPGRAAQSTFWYVRIHNRILGSGFGRQIDARNAKVTTPSAGVLRFLHTGRRISGQISCLPATKADKRNFGCRWQITVKRRGVYWGVGLVTLYRPEGFNVSAAWSRCRPLVRGSSFCRRYPPPSG